MVYEHGCGFAHPDIEIDYSSPCKVCEGTGLALIECEPCPDIEDAYERSPMTPLRFWPFVSLIVIAMAIVAVCTVTGRLK
jgi:hypothetical protein